MLADDPWDNVRSRNHLAMTYLAEGRLAKAIPLYKRTLAHCERMLGANHPSTLRSRINLATSYRAAGRAAAAIPLLERTLADCERVLGANHPDTKVVRQDLFALTGKPPRQRMPFETEEEPRPTSGRRTRGGRAGSYQPWSRRAAG